MAPGELCDGTDAARRAIDAANCHPLSGRRLRKKEFMTIFINGKQKRVRRPPIDGVDVGDFILRNADPIWMHQNEMFDYMTDDEES